MNREEQTHALELAEQLLEDIEYSRIPVEQLVLKAARLARLVGDENVIQWLGCERDGYPMDEPANEWLYRTRRVHLDPAETVYAGAVQLGPLVKASQSELSSLTVPDLSGDMMFPTMNNVLNRIGTTKQFIAKVDAILATVSGQLHKFATEKYYALRFATRQDAMFDRATSEIDSLLGGLGETPIRRLDSAYANIRAGDEESLSGAMNSLRRLIDSFADSTFPATTTTRLNGQGGVISLGEAHKLNRVKAFIEDNAKSDGHATRLKRAVSDIYGRVSTGVHKDVSASEAEYLFLSTYVLLGEILALRNADDAVAGTVTVP